MLEVTGNEEGVRGPLSGGPMRCTHNLAKVVHAGAVDGRRGRRPKGHPSADVIKGQIGRGGGEC